MNIKSKSSMGRWAVVLVLVAALLVAFCAGLRKVGFEQPSLSYRWQKGVTLHYELETQEQQSLESMGQSVRTETNFYMVISALPTEVYDDGSAIVDFVIDSISVVAESPMGELRRDLSRLMGKHKKLHLAATGQMISQIASDGAFEVKFGRMRANLGDIFKRMLINVPDRPVQIGESWTETDTSNSSQDGLDVQVISHSKHRVVRAQELGDVKCLLIRTESDLSMEGSGKELMTGSDMAFEGEGTSTSEWLFDPVAGRLLQLDTTTKIEGTMALSGPTEMMMPLESTSRIQVRLLK